MLTDNLQAILFDNDGVLTHTESLWFSVNSEVMTELEIPYTREDFIVHTFIEGWGTDGWLMQAGYDETIRQSFKQKRDTCVQPKLLSDTTCDPAAEAVIKELASRYTLGIVTNTNEEHFGLLTTRFPFLNTFEVHILREQYQSAKPAPDAYQAALTKLALPATAAIVIEDSPRGIAAAKAAGISVVGIVNPDFPELDLSEADEMIENLSQLTTLV